MASMNYLPIAVVAMTERNQENFDSGAKRPVGFGIDFALPR